MDEKDLKESYRPPLPPRPSRNASTSSSSPSQTQPGSQSYPKDEKHLYDYSGHSPDPGQTHTTQNGFPGFTYAHSPFDPPPLPAYTERPAPPTLIRNQIEDAPKEVKLPCVIPQTSHTLHGTIYRPFARAYPPALATTTATYNDASNNTAYQGPSQPLAAGQISPADFLAFIDGLNAVWLANPYLQAAGASTIFLGFIPLLEVQLAMLGVQVATEYGSVKLSQMRTQAYLRLANEELFVPRGMRVQVLKTSKMMEVVGVPGDVLELGCGKGREKDGDGEEVFDDRDDVGSIHTPTSPRPPSHAFGEKEKEKEKGKEKEKENEDLSSSRPTSSTKDPFAEPSTDKQSKYDPQLRRLAALEGYIQPLQFDTDLPLSENWLKRVSEKQSRLFASRQNSIFTGKRDKAAKEISEAQEAEREINAKVAEVEAAQREVRARARERLEGPLGESMQGRLIVQGDLEKEMKKWEKKMDKLNKEREKRVTKKFQQSQRRIERVEKREEKIAQRVMWVVVTEDDGRGFENHLWEDSD